MKQDYVDILRARRYAVYRLMNLRGKMMSIFDSLLNNAKKSLEGQVNSAIRKTVSEAKNKAAAAVQKSLTHSSKTFTFNAIPASLTELKALKEADMKDPSGVAALTILVMNALALDREAGVEMLEYLNGPSEVSPSDRQFVQDRFMDGKDYVPRSYFKGAVPANNYTPDRPYTIVIEEQPHSKDNFSEGYMKLFVRSGGADSERYIVLRTKPSTGEWFVWDYSGILADIRIPVEKDEWA